MKTTTRAARTFQMALMLLMFLSAVAFSLHSCGGPYQQEEVYWTGTPTGGSNSSTTGGSNSSTGSITTLASGLHSPSSIALYGDYVYWSDYYDNKILRVKKTGGDVETIVSSNISYPLNICIEGDYIYIAEANPLLPNQAVNSLTRIGAGGTGNPVTLYNSRNYIAGVAVDTNNIYWTERTTTSGILKQAPKNGNGTVLDLVYDLKRPGAVAVRNSNVYYVVEGSSTDGILSSGDGAIRKIAAGGGSVVILATNLNFPCSISLSTVNAFFCEAGSFTGSTTLGSIRKSTLTQAGNLPVLTGLNRVTDIYHDSSNYCVYFSESDGTNNATGYLKRVGSDGNNTTILADSQSDPGEMITDSSYVYWIQANWSGSEGKIMRTGK